MNQLSEMNANERTDPGASTLIEQSFERAGTNSSTACVSPILEGKSLTNNYIESLLLNAGQNTNQVIAASLGQNLGVGLNLGFGLNMNIGVNELNSSFPLILPSQLCQVNNVLGAVQAALPDCYNTMPRGYNLNNPIIPQNVIPVAGIPITNFSGIESVLCTQSNLLSKEENQPDINPMKLDSQQSIINPLLQSPLLSSIGSQPSIINPNIIPRISPIISPCPGSIYQNPLVSGVDNCNINKIKKPVFPLKKETTNITEENDKLNSLLNSYFNNIASLADAHERVKNYLNANSGFDKSASIVCGDSTKLLGNVGVPDYGLSNVQLEHISMNNLTSGISQRIISSNTEQCIPGEPNDVFKISHTRKYRLGDQGRALLKSELSAYLRNHPEKRVEASKIADIRNATTKQLWQIAAMCGLEERFINLHAQSIAQSKGKVGLRGAKRKLNASINELSKTAEQTTSGDSTLPTNVTDSPELDPKANATIEISVAKSSDSNQISSSEENAVNIEVNIQTEIIEDKSVNIEGEINVLDTANEHLNSGWSEMKENSIIFADNDVKRMRVDT
ncbi:uncharacterized protein cubi_03509 [Cryptosporidium ubiquitum]|uniref:Uncharacterized protein n=1 Tax=Cryptosporidium ubiquitum TaxID=857276 RepID=A0A1J4MI66_9CRYT|nr:uncharacterized protein cubi_03509 [Cryptosporidium ubiquitum]OII73711.1 hypothetical protein cubi_03509 [Cryptosporidium ubiquitum]